MIPDRRDDGFDFFCFIFPDSDSLEAVQDGQCALLWCLLGFLLWICEWELKGCIMETHTQSRDGRLAVNRPTL